MLKRLSTIRVWTGFRPATPDNLPYIGKLPDQENIYIAAGHEGLGITTSLGTAELIAARGYAPVALPAAEIAKLDAGLSCMSLRWLSGSDSSGRA